MTAEEVLKNTAVFKHIFDGWKAETYLPIDLDDGKQHEIHIYTSKRGHALNTSATVHLIDKHGYTTHVMFEDFYKVYQVTQARCTERRVRDQHNSALTQVETIIKEAKDFYKRKKENG